MGSSLSNAATGRLLLKVLSQIPDYHKNTFHYVCEFLKEMLKFSDHNGLDIKVLGKRVNCQRLTNVTGCECMHFVRRHRIHSHAHTQYRHIPNRSE